MASYLQSDQSWVFRKGCLDLYNSYFGQRGRAAVLMGQLLDRAGKSQEGAVQRMAVRAYFVSCQKKLSQLLGYSQGAETEDETQAIWNYMHTICRRMEDARLRAKSPGFLPFLEVSGIGAANGSHWAEWFCEKILPPDSSIRVLAGERAGDGSSPIVLVGRDRIIREVGSLSISSKEVSLDDLLGPEGNELLSFPSLLPELDSPPSKPVAKISMLSAKASISGEHTLNGKDCFQGVLSDTGNDYSLAIKEMRKALEARADHAEAKKALDSPEYSFSFEVPGKCGAAFDFDASMGFQVGGTNFSIVARMPGSKLLIARAFPNGETLETELKNCRREKVGW